VEIISFLLAVKNVMALENIPEMMDYYCGDEKSEETFN
jgi:hypothetical protein